MRALILCVVVFVLQQANGQDYRVNPASPYPAPGADHWEIQNLSATNVVVTSGSLGSLVLAPGAVASLWDDSGFFINAYGVSPCVLSSGVDSSFAFVGGHSSQAWVLQVGGGGNLPLTANSWRLVDPPHLLSYVESGMGFALLVCGFAWQKRIAMRVGRTSVD